jgi:hypothetical protein
MNREDHLSGATFEKGFKRKHEVNNEPMEPPRELIKWWQPYAEWLKGSEAASGAFSAHRGEEPPNVVKNRRVRLSANV